MDTKTTTLEKQRAAAQAVLGGKASSAEPKKPKPVAKKATKKPKAKKPIGARIKVIKSAKPKAPKPKKDPKPKPKKDPKPKVKKDPKPKVPKAPKAPKAPKPKVKKDPKPKAPKPKKAKVDPKALDRVDLNANEGKVLEVLAQARTGMTLVDLAKATFPRKTRAQGNSWVRNAMRRLVRGELVVKVDRGTYRATPKGLGEDLVRSPVLAESEPKTDLLVSPPSESAEQVVEQVAVVG